MDKKKKYILTEADVKRKLQRMAYEIAERNVGKQPGDLILAGIRDNGVVIAAHLKAFLQSIYPGEITVIEIGLDKRHPGAIFLNANLSYTDKDVILIDDVANSGKTMLYALKPFLEDHPRSIQTLALVERTHKMFPIHTDYVGLSLSTTLQEHIIVEVVEGMVTGAYLA